MKPEDLIRQYLPQANLMQLATSVNDQPWVATVHYYSDQDLNIYWISREDRQHSKHIASNPKVAAAILVHENTIEEKYVIGISVEGTAELLGSDVSSEIGQAFIAKHNRTPAPMEDIVSGQSPHKFYRMKPSKLVLFDSKNFSGDPRQEWVLP